MWTRIAQSALLVVMMAAVPVASAETGPTTIPENLKVPRERVVLFKTVATGVQLYTCKARTDAPGTFEWTFKAPVAELRNEAGEKVGTHYAGPTWEGNDGSKVMGEVVERANAPDPSAIPWLLLKAKSNAGTGVFSTVSHVQRLETVGGIAPTDGCNQSTADTERAVEYRATYTFAYRAAQ